MVSNLSTEIATRTSRRSFLGRSGKLLLGVVGATAAAGAFAEQALAGCSCTPIACELDCLCAGNKYYVTYRCGDCSGCIHHQACSNITCD